MVKVLDKPDIKEKIRVYEERLRNEMGLIQKRGQPLREAV